MIKITLKIYRKIGVTLLMRKSLKNYWITFYFLFKTQVAGLFPLHSRCNSHDFNFVLKGKPYFLLIDFTFWVILNPCNLPSSIEGIMLQIKSCVRYIFSILFFKSKRELLRNQKNCFLFHFKSSVWVWVWVGRNIFLCVGGRGKVCPQSRPMCYCPWV